MGGLDCLSGGVVVVVTDGDTEHDSCCKMPDLALIKSHCSDDSFLSSPQMGCLFGENYKN